MLDPDPYQMNTDPQPEIFGDLLFLEPPLICCLFRWLFGTWQMDTFAGSWRVILARWKNRYWDSVFLTDPRIRNPGAWRPFNYGLTFFWASEKTVLFIPDPESGSWIFTHPGSRGQKGTRSRVSDTGYRIKWKFNFAYFYMDLWLL